MSFLYSTYASKKIDYFAIKHLLNDIFDMNLADFLILYYIPDILNYFSMPNNVQRRVETQHCKMSVEERGIPYNVMKWKMFECLHGLHDNPALFYSNDSTKFWMKCDFYHRENDLPVNEETLSKHWYYKGVPFRKNSNDPHCITSDGSMWWYDQYGICHREDDLPACIIVQNGQEVKREWIIHGKFHRLCGPAVVYATGEVEWWKDSARYTDVTFTTLFQ